MTRDGAVFDLARNAASRSELCGVCFSPDGRAMFVNVQEDGLTLVITGPFGRWAGGTGEALGGESANPSNDESPQSMLTRAAIPIVALTGVAAVGAGLRRRVAARGSRRLPRRDP